MYRDFFKKKKKKTRGKEKEKKTHKNNREAWRIGQSIYFQYTDSSFDVFSYTSQVVVYFESGCKKKIIISLGNP